MAKECWSNFSHKPHDVNLILTSWDSVYGGARIQTDAWMQRIHQTCSSLVPRSKEGINTAGLQHTFLEYSLQADRCVHSDQFKKYTPTNHSNAFWFTLSTTKCAESKACQMHFHSSALYPSVLYWNSIAVICLDEILAALLVRVLKCGCDHMLLCMPACSEWLSRVHGRWKRVLRASLWAPGWRGRECGSGSGTVCDNGREELSPGPGPLPALSSGLAGSTPLVLLQQQSLLLQHRAPACVSPRLSSASQPEPAGSSPGTL